MSKVAQAEPPPEEHAFCPVHGAINLLQEKWTLHIIRSLLDGPMGFNELSRAVGGVGGKACNPATLSQRLESLEATGVLAKTIHSTMPPRTSYALSEAGQALQSVIASIDGWGRTYLAKEPLSP
jgi:DNA-binding HxlR family transcriptional regulator